MKRILPQAHKYYLVPNPKGDKTHLLYFTQGYGELVAHQACLPNIPVEIKVGPCGDHYITDMTIEHASYFDEHCGDLTCPTCLNMAAGNHSMQLSLSSGGD